MIIYYIIYPSYRRELYKYFILNDTNCYLFLIREKGGSIILELRLRLRL